MTHLFEKISITKDQFFPASFCLLEAFCHVAKLLLLKDSTLGNGCYVKTSNEYPSRDLHNLVRVYSGLRRWMDEE